MNKKRNRVITCIVILFIVMIACFGFVYEIHNYKYLAFVFNNLKLNEKLKSNYNVKLVNDDNFILNNNTSKYIVNLIDDVNVNFNYSLDTNRKINGIYSYYIIGSVKSSSNSINTEVFRSELKTGEINGNVISINDNFHIDINDIYQKYQKLFADFEIDNIDSYLNYDLYFDINVNHEDLKYEKTNNLNIINIPLEKETDIENNNQDNNIYIVDKNKENDNLLYYIIISEVALSGLLFGVIIILLFKELSVNVYEYDKKVSNILAKYGSYIVELKDLPDLSKHRILSVTNINELKDAAINLALPINYVNIESHTKCIFFVFNGKNVYLLKIEKGKNVN